MSRIRTIKPGFFRSLTIASLPVSTRLTFIGLWTYVDDEGRGVDDPRLIKAELWPLDDTYTAKKVDRDLDQLAAAGRVERYAVDGRRYLRITTWAEHQRINRPQPSTLPTPCGFSERAVNEQGARTEDALPEGKGRERKGKEPSPESRSDTTGPATNGGPETMAMPSQDTLVARLVGVCTDRGPAVVSEATEVIARCRRYLDDKLIDEAIGFCGDLAGSRRPRRPRYLIDTLNDWAPKRGLVGITIPKLEAVA